jgi:hypothetical protein
MNRVSVSFRASALRIFFPKIHSGIVNSTTATFVELACYLLFLETDFLCSEMENYLVNKNYVRLTESATKNIENVQWSFPRYPIIDKVCQSKS